MSVSSSSLPTISIFTSFPQITPALRAAAPHVPLEEIVDGALTGNGGGTVAFDASQLTAHTRQRLSQAEILVTEPAALAAILRDDAQAFPALKWCQSTYAGVDSLFAVPLEEPSFCITRFAGKKGPLMAEWCLARIIGHERDFATTARLQQERAWAASQSVVHYRYLSDLTVTILGCGDLGQCIARVCKAMGMRVVGFVRKARDSLGPFDVWETNLGRALQEADYVISVLPSTPDTRNLLSGEALAPASKANGGKSPAFLNIGRGDVMDEASLLHALEESYISAAILDVFPVEPLPVESPLWSHPQVTVSPHVSSTTRCSDMPGLVLRNYEHYIHQKPLEFVVDWKKGY